MSDRILFLARDLSLVSTDCERFAAEREAEGYERITTEEYEELEDTMDRISCPGCGSYAVVPTGLPVDGLAEYRCDDCGHYFVDEGGEEA